MNDILKTFNFWAWPYFYVMIIIGAFFLINITLAIIKVKFTETEKKEKDRKKLIKENKFILLNEKQENIEESYSLENLRELKIIPSKKERSLLFNNSKKPTVINNKNKISPLLETNQYNKINSEFNTPLNTDRNYEKNNNVNVFHRINNAKNSVFDKEFCIKNNNIKQKIVFQGIIKKNEKKTVSKEIESFDSEYLESISSNFSGKIILNEKKDKIEGFFPEKKNDIFNNNNLVWENF